MQLGVRSDERGNLKRYLDFVARSFNSNGAFNVVGYSKFSGGSNTQSQTVHYTCFALIAFLVNRNMVDNFSTYENQISKSFSYVEGRLSVDNYAASICAYALALDDRPASGRLLTQLDLKGRTDGVTKYWDLDDNVSAPHSTRVVIAGYIARAYMHLNRMDKAKPIIKWLMKQRNANGGFSDTYSTVVGMEALAEMALRTRTVDPNMKIKITNERGQSETRQITPSNAVSAQLIEMPKRTLNAMIEAEGTGYALVTTYYEFTKTVENISNVFDLHVSPYKEGNELRIVSCATKKLPSKTDQIIMEFSLSSGYVYMAEKSDPMAKDSRKIIHVNFY